MQSSTEGGLHEKTRAALCLPKFESLSTVSNRQSEELAVKDGTEPSVPTMVVAVASPSEGHWKADRIVYKMGVSESGLQRGPNYEVLLSQGEKKTRKHDDRRATVYNNTGAKASNRGSEKGACGKRRGSKQKCDNVVAVKAKSLGGMDRALGNVK